MVKLSLNEIHVLLKCIEKKLDIPEIISVKEKLEKELNRLTSNLNPEIDWFFDPLNVFIPISELIEVPEEIKKQNFEAVLRSSEIKAELNRRVLNVLRRFQFEIIDDLLKKSPSDIHRLRNLGEGSQKVLARFLWSLHQMRL
ncbi:DNA-directed RNA polymerase subunit alpha C-terminal domain-containing protein [Paenibacillus macquariensis]|uniref:RNA polymerase, alpha chain C terminal domain n=1 Tax=Paenibacillus macquariensis TaxID=948756 RepID=A0ABY1KEY9_9BACL|nr:DNA-directed RNA polymerase subunit alpha C-terminal domain-containing protein [Paenibacillus macquariensis]OAB29599.1 hypothetical protein PMSM_23735 [Paenibacillus macquariensis subsp. macquariensis]SIR73605.1 RNA polymerase, alpha chain C terminal domain [Paenibacillus macquariensis]